jgi:hypothetical protein
MSMLSAQCDELRAMAESVGLEVPQAATLMMEAADTIWQLRDDLQRANDAVRDAEHDESCAWDRVRKAEAEADKLRELVRASWKCIHAGLSCSDCRLIAGGCTLQTAMRELGIEV